MAAGTAASATQPSTAAESGAGEAAGESGGSRPRLDDWTFSVLAKLREREEKRHTRQRDGDRQPRNWRVAVFPGAKEAAITPWRSPSAAADGTLIEVEAVRAGREALARLREMELDREFRRLVEEADERSEQRAVRRARSMIRRICRQYDLCRMWTLTFRGDGCHDRAQLVRYIDRWEREMKARFPKVVYLAVPEMHPGGHGWHVHVAVSEYIHWSEFNRTWPHGQTESPRGPDGQKLAGKIDATATALYLGKYVAKSLGEGREYLGQHRYFRPRGLEIAVEVTDGTLMFGFDEARNWARAYFGGAEPTVELQSDQLEDHDGPPFAWLDFWPRRGRPRRAQAET